MSRTYTAPVRKTIEEYLLLLAGDVAERLIRIKLNDYPKDSGIQPDPFKDEINLSIEGDGRIANKVYESLNRAGALLSFIAFRPDSRYYNFNSSPRKERMRYQGKVNEKWFNEQASTFASAPVFETAGLVTKTQDSWSTKTVRETVTEFQNYRKLHDYPGFTDAEFIHIWFHLDEYDVHTLKETYYSNKHSSTTTESKIIYPKVMLQDLSKGVFKGHAEDYAEKHIQWAMEHLLGIKKERVINILDMDTPPRPKCKIKEFKDWTEENITLQLDHISSLQALLNMCQKSFTQLLSKVIVYGGWDKLKEDSKKEFLKYLEENFPLHMGDDEPDEELRKLSRWVAEGKNKGFNERLQMIQAGGTKCSLSNEAIQ